MCDVLGYANPNLALKKLPDSFKQFSTSENVRFHFHVTTSIPANKFLIFSLFLDITFSSQRLNLLRYLCRHIALKVHILKVCHTTAEFLPHSALLLSMAHTQNP